MLREPGQALNTSKCSPAAALPPPFKAARGAWRAAETHVALSHVSFGHAQDAPASLEPVLEWEASDAFKALWRRPGPGAPSPGAPLRLRGAW